MCSPHYLERKTPLDSPERILDADLLHDETRQAWQNWFSKAGIRTTKELTGPVFQDFNLLATAVIAGHGVALCPIEVFREEILNRDLVVLSEIETLENEGYFLSISVTPSIIVRSFVEWFVSVTSKDM